MTSMSSCNYVYRSSIAALGMLLILSGVYLYLNWIEMFTQLRGKEMALSPTSPSYASWKVSPLPLHFDVYLFNWTNPQEFYVGSSVKPHFEQLGPYRFLEVPDKVDIEWHDHNSTMSFRKKAYFHFDALGSNGSLTDMITSVNTVLHAAALQAKDAHFIAKSLLQSTFKLYNEELSVTKTADQWLFAGYVDPLVTMGNFFSHFSSSIVVPFDRIGWMYTRNGSATYDGHFNMHTGAANIYQMGQVQTWNQQTSTGAFPDECGEVKGSMGEFFPANLSPNDSVSIFLPNLCRAVPLDYTETVKIHGVTAYKFSGTERAVDNGTMFPEAKCFCVNGKCEAAGVINISPCKYNSSIYMSYPHFYKADPSFLAAVDGLSPDAAKHEFFMSLEPNAGVVMDVGGGFQANYLMEPVAGIKPYENVPRIFIPLMWCEERVTVTPAIAGEIALVPLIVLLGQIVTGALLATGVILMCWYPTKLISQMCHDPKKKPALLRPLSNGGPRSIVVSAASYRPNSKGLASAVPMLEYRNGAFRPQNDPTITESLLGDARLEERDVIMR